ncbi:helix-turn-helix domain-containing protein, partial [Escherichia coli]|nr:helix-turn-helix domain-containing protein [Escherichia coli]
GTRGCKSQTVRTGYHMSNETNQLKPRVMGSVKDAAERWAISEKTIRRMVNAGELVGYYPTPRTLRVDMLELDTLMESRATRKVVK